VAPEIPISRLQVATVYVSDAGNAIDFWTKQLKFEMVADWSGENGDRMVFVRPADAITEIGLYQAGSGDLRVGKPTGLVFTSPDVRSTVKQLKERGVKIVADIVMHDYGEGDGPEDTGDLEATFADPDGNTFLIHS
jgi:catechol 2,3-dioxygenase-like lactoylglutathione lyase family enzyme